MRKSTRILTNLRTVRSLYGCQMIPDLPDESNIRRLASLPVKKRLQCDISFHGMLKPIRRCSTVRGIVKACWKCEKVSEMWNYMICDECGYLQDVENDVNYFDLLNCERKFEVEPKELSKKFRELQTYIHPDKFLSRPVREQINSEAWSALLNKAYKTLSVPVDRGEYLLNSKGLQIPQDNSVLDKKFLAEMMDRHFEVEDAKTKKSMLALQKKIGVDMNAKVKELKKHFDANDLNSAIATLVKLKYLISIESNIKKKIELTLGN